MTPTLNGLYSRKDARRPGVVRVLDIVAGTVLWQSLDDPNKSGEVAVASWGRRYRPFTAPVPTSPAPPPVSGRPTTIGAAKE